MISIYIKPALLKQNNVTFASLFKGFAPVQVSVLKQKKSKPQFVQYHELLGSLDKQMKINQQNNTFLLFSDDDDLWHKDRCRHYYAAWADIPDATTRDSCTVIQCVDGLDHKNPNCCSIENTQDVDNAILCGCVENTLHTRETMLQNATKSTEYHLYAVRPYVLRNYFSHPNHMYLTKYNRFVDMHFKAFVFTYKGGAAYTAKIAAQPWSYFYRRGNDNYEQLSKPVFKLDINDIHFLIEIQSLLQRIAEMDENYRMFTCCSHQLEQLCKWAKHHKLNPAVIQTSYQIVRQQRIAFGKSHGFTFLETHDEKQEENQMKSCWG